MTWWQICFIIAVSGVLLDDMVCTICRTIVLKKKENEKNE